MDEISTVIRQLKTRNEDRSLIKAKLASLKRLLGLDEGKTNLAPQKPTIVRIKNRVDPERSPDPYFQMFKHALVGKTDLVIDLTKAEFIYPFALVLFLALQKTLEKHGGTLTMHIQEGSAVHEYLDFCGFAETFGLTKFDESKRTLNSKTGFKMIFVRDIPNPNKMAEELIDYLKEGGFLNGFNETALIDSISEIIANVRQHSSFSQLCLMAQTYPTSGRIRFVICDDGIGIRNHLTQKKYEDTHAHFRHEVTREIYEKMQKDATTAIKYAAKNMVSGTDYKINSGAGINFLIETTRETNGTVSILSEDGFAVWKEDFWEYPQDSKIPLKIDGTIVSITMNRI